MASTDQAALELVKTNFLIRKLGLADGPHLMEAIDTAFEIHGGPEPKVYRAVLYYMLVKQLGRESVYG